MLSGAACVSGGAPAAQPPILAHPVLPLETASESVRLEWQVSRLLANHQTSLEALLADHQRRSSRASDACAEQLQQQVERLGRVGDLLAQRLDGLQDLAATWRAQQGQSEVQHEGLALKAVGERLQRHEERVDAMQKQILTVLVEILTTVRPSRWAQKTKGILVVPQTGVSVDSCADKDLPEVADPPVVQRQHDQAAKQHEALHEKHDRLHDALHEKHDTMQERIHQRHEESLAKLHESHTAILSEMAEQVKAFGSRAGKGSFIHQLSTSSDERTSTAETKWGEQAVKPEDSLSSSMTLEPAPRLTKGTSAISLDTMDEHHFRGMSTSSKSKKGEEDRQSSSKAVSVDVQTLQDLQGWHRGKSSLPPVGLERFRGALEAASSVLIIINILYLGLETEVGMDAAQRGQPSPDWLWYCSLVFAIVFLLELVVRIAMERWAFFGGRNWKWNVFDSALVAVQFVDVAFAVINLSFVRCLRSMRSLRALRIIKTITLVRELRLMVASIGASFTHLLWSFVLLVLALYLFSLALEQTIQAHIEISGGTAGLHADLMNYYGSLGSAMVTLFMAISGGMDWSDLVAPLLQISKAYLVFFMGFITFVLFGMLNILTAVFVEATNRIAEVDQDLVIQGHLDHEDSVVAKVREFLGHADVDGSGTISKVEFESRLLDPYFQAQLKLLELDGFEAHAIFKILNIHDNDEVDIEELIYGLIRLKGNAKAVDVVTMLCESRRIVQRLVAFMRYTEDNFRDLRDDLGLRLRENKDMKTYIARSNAGSNGLKN